MGFPTIVGNPTPRVGGISHPSGGKSHPPLKIYDWTVMEITQPNLNLGPSEPQLNWFASESVAISMADIRLSWAISYIIRLLRTGLIFLPQTI